MFLRERKKHPHGGSIEPDRRVSVVNHTELYPGCGQRIFDSDKSPYVAPLSNSNKDKADMVLKHHDHLIAVQFRRSTNPDIILAKDTQQQ
jgi:hypothetical protein